MDQTCQVLISLVAIANETSENQYDFIPFALGYIPCKNGVNMVDDIGHSFIGVARWLLNEIESNLSN